MSIVSSLLSRIYFVCKCGSRAPVEVEKLADKTSVARLVEGNGSCK